MEGFITWVTRQIFEKTANCPMHVNETVNFCSKSVLVEVTMSLPLRLGYFYFKSLCTAYSWIRHCEQKTEHADSMAHVSS